MSPRATSGATQRCHPEQHLEQRSGGTRTCPFLANYCVLSFSKDKCRDRGRPGEDDDDEHALRRITDRPDCMEQLRQVGEALGGINALMAFADDLRMINPRQCRLLADACALAFAAVAAEARAAHLFRLDYDRGQHAKWWKPLEPPLRELHRAVRDAEGYVRGCLLLPLDGGGGASSWWARAAAATHGADCVEHHLHGLLWCVAVAIEAVEEAGSDDEAAARRRVLLAKDLDRDMLDPGMFAQRLGVRYLATRELAARMDMAWKEDRWLLAQHLESRKTPTSPTELAPPLTRHEHRLADVLTSPRGKVHPASVLYQGDFQIRRRLALSGSHQLKEAQWLGDAFAVKHFVGVDATATAADDAVSGEVAALTSVAHPNVAHCRYVFHDEERRELFLVMDQLMTKDLGGYVKEVTSAKRRTPSFPLAVAVDVMLQVARGMEYLHSKKIYHGDLNPANVLVKTRHADNLVVKVAGFGQSGGVSAASSPRPSPRASSAANAAANNANANANLVNPCIWYAPEVLEQEGYGQTPACKCTEKADVYSFAMICFELLTGKIPFEDNHLQGEHMSKNIRAGERPLFPFSSPKYLVSLTKRCWHADPAQRPAFASVCRVLRYVKRYLVLNPPLPQDQDAPAAAPTAPPFDYLDIEANLLRRFPAWQGTAAAPRVADVPFQMFAYRVMEKEKTRAMLQVNRDKASDSSSDGNSLCGDDGSSFSAMLPDHDSLSVSSRTTTWSLPERISSSSSRKASPRKMDGKVTSRLAGPPQKSKSMGVVRPPQIAARRTPRIKSDGQLNSPIPPSRRRNSGGGGHLSDSELA